MLFNFLFNTVKNVFVRMVPMNSDFNKFIQAIGSYCFKQMFRACSNLCILKLPYCRHFDTYLSSCPLNET